MHVQARAAMNWGCFLLFCSTKTDAIVFGTLQRLVNHNEAQGSEIVDEVIQLAEAVKLLGTILDSTPSADSHVTKSC
jgi:hypothetical protein